MTTRRPLLILTGPKKRTTRTLREKPESHPPLFLRGYRPYLDATQECVRIFQKRMDDDTGVSYFINFREWHRPQTGTTFDAQLCSRTNCWVTIQEESIEQTEARAGVHYDA